MTRNGWFVIALVLAVMMGVLLSCATGGGLIMLGSRLNRLAAAQPPQVLAETSAPTEELTPAPAVPSPEQELGDAPISQPTPVPTPIPAPTLVAQTATEEEGCDADYESIVITPQGRDNMDGTFTAQDVGERGTYFIFDGEVTLPGETVDDGVTDFVIGVGGSAEITYSQGTFRQFPCKGYNEILNDNIIARNIPDKFATSPVTRARIWHLDENNNLIHLLTIDRPS